MPDSHDSPRPVDYVITVHREVKKFLRNHDELRNHWAAIESTLVGNPRRGSNIDHLNTPWHCNYRLRQGNYRLKYEVLDNDREIHIYDASTRGQAYQGRRGSQNRRR